MHQAVGTPKYVEEVLIGLKGETDYNTMKEDFSSLLSGVERSHKIFTVMKILLKRTNKQVQQTRRTDEF